MVRASLREATNLQRVERVDDHNRTPDRDEAADCIETQVINGNRPWSDWTIVELSDVCGWSRQHISVTLEHYFVAEGSQNSGGGSGLDALLGGVEGSEEYREGFVDGLRVGLSRRDEIQDWLSD